MTPRINSPKDLLALRDRARDEIELRTGPKEIQIMVHMGTCGIAAGARDVLAALATELEKADIKNVTLRQSGCAGLCDREPMFTLTDASGQQYRYGRLDAKKVRKIVSDHVAAGCPVIEHLIT